MQFFQHTVMVRGYESTKHLILYPSISLRTGYI